MLGESAAQARALSGRDFPPRRKAAYPKPANPASIIAQVDGSGTGEAEAFPEKLAVKEATVAIPMWTAGLTLVKVKPSALGEPRASAGMTSEISVSAFGGLPTMMLSWFPTPSAASVKDPLK